MSNDRIRITSLFATCILTVFSFVATAQQDSVRPWKVGGGGTFTFNQISLTNWAAGGESAISGNSLLNLFANYKKGESSWETNLDLGYGLVRQESKKVIKSDDKIDFASKYGYKAGTNWYYTGMLSAKSQFTEGYKYPNDSVAISNFLAPAYILGSLGMDFKKGEIFTIFLSPFTGKTTLVYDQVLADSGAFGVNKAILDNQGNIITPGKNIRNEFGGYFKAALKLDIMKNISLNSKVDMFSNLLEKPENVDITWENTLVMKVNKLIAITFNTLLIYDDDTKIGIDDNGDGVVDRTAPRTQFKQVFGVGFSYKF